ncbi:MULTISPECIES: peptidase inhibitor family I36 protein [Sphaerobacter]|nr:peptidase inhibitor family I36 protein [Sphaerobacter sp.]
MHKKSLLVALALALSSVAAAGSVQAELEECDSGHVCMWGNTDFNWLIGERPSGGGLVALSGAANNQMDSWANGSNTNAAGYDNWDGTGDCQTFHAFGRDNNVAFWNSDEVSSWRTNRGC